MGNVSIRGGTLSKVEKHAFARRCWCSLFWITGLAWLGYPVA
jgi:hypothetical protein